MAPNSHHLIQISIVEEYCIFRTINLDKNDDFVHSTKNGALDSQPQVIKFTSCLPMVGGSLRVLRLLPPLKLVAMI
jgi:hypothetical protein